MAGSVWPALVAGARAKASEVESKFDWVEGDIVPMTGGTRTDATYDLGTSSHRWRDAYLSRQLFLADGSVTAPSTCWTNSIQMGFYRIGNNNLGGAVAGVKWLDVSSAGEVLLPLQPSFFAYLTNSTTMTSAGYFTVTSYTEQFDSGSDFSSGTGIFTVPRSGRYQFGLSTRMTHFTTTTDYDAGIAIKALATGTATTDIRADYPDGVKGTPSILVNATLSLLVGDKVYCNVLVGAVTTTGYPILAGATPNIATSVTTYYTCFWGKLIG